jgi:hypothetical protein
MIMLKDCLITNINALRKEAKLVAIHLFELNESCKVEDLQNG